MNQLDLHPHKIDPKVFSSFSLDQMEALTFLPLYQEESSLHVAVPLDADDTLTKRIQSLAPAQSLVLHPASPDQIRELLRAARERQDAPTDEGESAPDSGDTAGLMTGDVKRAVQFPAPDKSAADRYWKQLIALMMAMPTHETLWLYETKGQCHVVQRSKTVNRTHLTIPAKVFHILHERLEDETAMAGMWDDARWLLINAPDGSHAAFKMWQMDCLEQHITWLQRLPAFSHQALLKATPQAAALIEELRHLYGEHRRLIIGGKDISLIKQCVYSLIEPTLAENQFPPAFFVEREAAMHFPGVAQLTQYEYSLIRLMENFDGEHAPFVFFETEMTELAPEDDILSRFWSGRWENIAVYMPFESIHDMREELQSHLDWRKGGFLPVFFHKRYLKTL